MKAFAPRFFYRGRLRRTSWSYRRHHEEHARRIRPVSGPLGNPFFVCVCVCVQRVPLSRFDKVDLVLVQNASERHDRRKRVDGLGHPWERAVDVVHQHDAPGFEQPIGQREVHHHVWTLVTSIDVHEIKGFRVETVQDARRPPLPDHHAICVALGILQKSVFDAGHIHILVFDRPSKGIHAGDDGLRKLLQKPARRSTFPRSDFQDGFRWRPTRQGASNPGDGRRKPV